jgi:hypothetical protein
MRRLKSTRFEGKCIVHLPKRIVKVVRAPFATREERQYYDAIEERTQVTALLHAAWCCVRQQQ